jgi:o-succinylbenzoate synthase
MISKIIFKKIRIGMKKPFRIFLGSSDVYEGFIVKVETDDGYQGYGEAVPTPYITGDTLGSINEELEGISTIIKGMDLSTEAIDERIRRAFRSSRASRAAIDMAIWDIIGKRANMPVYRILGNYRESIRTSYTVDLVDPQYASEMASSFLSQGVKVFKIKMGSGIEKDVERVKVVRETVGDDKMVYVDFNQAYSAKNALRVIEKIEKYNIEFVEQPVPAHSLQDLKFVRNSSPIPVMGDEAIFSIYDASRVISMEAVDLINVKLMKAGGITEAIKIIDLAESYNIPVMVGCMVETSLALSAGLSVALGKRNVKYADLDGNTSLLEDVSTEGFVFKEGELSFTGLPGLGIKMKEIL